MDYWAEELSKIFEFVSGEMIRGEEIGRDKIQLETQKVILDTYYCSDIKMYETALLTEEEIYIMERYPDIENAEQGHAEWLDKTKQGYLCFFGPQSRKIMVVK